VFGGIVYGLVGLVPAVGTFWKFILTLVLFNLTTAAVVLLLSIAFANQGTASLVGTLVMMFKCVSPLPSPFRQQRLTSSSATLISLMFAGLLINRDSVPAGLRWLHTTSFFHAAFEALAVNELRYLHLKEHKVRVV
jgi:ABC-type multidrug transport system permease subunit